MRDLLRAACALCLLAPAAFAAPVNGTGDVTPGIIFGNGGNDNGDFTGTNGDFTGTTANGIELALRGKLRFDNSGGPENTFN